MSTCFCRELGTRAMCVCVRVFFPSILVTVPPIKARRVLHFAAYSGDYTIAAYLSVLLNQPGSHRRGRTLGLFSSFYISLMPLPLLRCLPSFFIARRVQPSLSLVDNEVEFCLLTKLFSFLSLSTTRYESEKNPLPPRFEPVTWSLEGYVDTN